MDAQKVGNLRERKSDQAVACSVRNRNRFFCCGINHSHVRPSDDLDPDFYSEIDLILENLNDTYRLRLQRSVPPGWIDDNIARYKKKIRKKYPGTK